MENEKMKFTVELELEGYEEGYSINDELKSQLSYQIAVKLAEMVAKTELKAIDYDAEVKEAKKMLLDTVEDLRSKRTADIEELKNTVTSVFNDFISGTAYRLNKWGQAEEQITVGEYIRDLISEHLEAKTTSLSKLVENKVDDAMKLTDWDMKKLIEIEANKARDANAKKVAEFIIKGAL